MDVLMELIKKKRKESSELSSKHQKKYIKRGELENQVVVTEKQQEIVVQKPKIDIKFTANEINAKFRIRKQPIRLFGEDDDARLERLLKLLGDENKEPTFKKLFPLKNGFNMRQCALPPQERNWNISIDGKKSVSGNVCQI